MAAADLGKSCGCRIGVSDLDLAGGRHASGYAWCGRNGRHPADLDALHCVRACRDTPGRRPCAGRPGGRLPAALACRRPRRHRRRAAGRAQPCRRHECRTELPPSLGCAASARRSGVAWRPAAVTNRHRHRAGGRGGTRLPQILRARNSMRADLGRHRQLSIFNPHRRPARPDRHRLRPACTCQDGAVCRSARLRRA